MAEERDGAWAASVLANKTTLPLPTVAKLMKLLSKGGIVVAQRGAAGGYRLAQKPENITIASVVEAVDGPISLTECAGGCVPTCAAKTLCGMQPGWKKINDAVHGALSNVFLSELSASHQV